MPQPETRRSGSRVGVERQVVLCFDLATSQAVETKFSTAAETQSLAKAIQQWLETTEVAARYRSDRLWLQVRGKVRALRAALVDEFSAAVMAVLRRPELSPVGRVAGKAAEVLFEITAPAQEPSFLRPAADKEVVRGDALLGIKLPGRRLILAENDPEAKQLRERFESLALALDVDGPAGVLLLITGQQSDESSEHDAGTNSAQVAPVVERWRRRKSERPRFQPLPRLKPPTIGLWLDADVWLQLLAHPSQAKVELPSSAFPRAIFARPWYDWLERIAKSQEGPDGLKEEPDEGGLPAGLQAGVAAYLGTALPAEPLAAMKVLVERMAHVKEQAIVILESILPRALRNADKLDYEQRVELLDELRPLMQTLGVAFCHPDTRDPMTIRAHPNSGRGFMFQKMPETTALPGTEDVVLKFLNHPEVMPAPAAKKRGPKAHGERAEPER